MALKIFHSILITLFMVIAYPIIAALTLIAMAIRFDDFCTIKEVNEIWYAAIHGIWAAE